MNHRSSGLKLSDAVEGFLQFKMAEGRSPRTIVGYRHDLREWLAYAGDKKVDKFDAQELRAFLNYLRTDYKPRRFSTELTSLSAKTVRNFWVTLSAYFTWLQREFDQPSPMENVPAPRCAKPEVEPFQPDELRAILKAGEFKREAKPTIRRRYKVRWAPAFQERAIILMLLDTGLRSSKLCALNIGDFYLKTGRIVVQGGPAGGT